MPEIFNDTLRSRTHEHNELGMGSHREFDIVPVTVTLMLLTHNDLRKNSELYAHNITYIHFRAAIE